ISPPDAIDNSTTFNTPNYEPPPLLPYQLLWYLAEHHLSQAASLPNSSSLTDFPKLTPQHQKHVLAAIKCLDAVLTNNNNGNQFMPAVELKTRFRLSQILFWFTENIVEAEMHLQKAILIAQKMDNVNELKFQIYNLQSKIFTSTNNIKAAKNLLKKGTAEAMENNMPDWTYHYLIQRADLCQKDSDFNGCLSVLKQAESLADQRGDIEMKACLLITVAQYAFTSQNYTIAQHTLAELSTIYFPPPSSQPPQTYHIFPITNRHLHLHYSLLFIAYHMHTGNMKFALEKLSEVHQLLDERREEENLDELKGYITAEIYTLTFLISGICNRGDTANVRASIFLTEGLKIVE
ncbi:12978_t:CDS:2, partial [Ambispora leptoticha]